MNIIDKKYKAKIPNLLIMDVIILITFGFLAMFSVKSVFTLNTFFTPNISMGLYIPAFVATFTGFGFIIFREYKYKRLNRKNVFVYLALALAFFNLLATIIIPNDYSLPYGSKLNLDFNKKLICILIGFSEAGLIIFYFYVLPKLFNNSNLIKLIYIIVISFILLCILLSFCLEGKIYIEILKSGFSSDLSVKSIIGHKNGFGAFLFIGISTSIFISTFTHNYKWLLASIPMILIIPFTSCKIAMLLTGILIICFAIYHIVKFARLNKNNLFIVLICASFCLIIIIVLSIFTVFSNTGLLFKIKNLINKIFTQGSTTFRSRIEIWKCSFMILSPAQFIFGCGTSIFNEALHIVYTQETNIWSAHNAYIELIGEGGILKLLIFVLILILLIYHLLKIYKKNKEFGFFYFVFIALFLIYGIVEQASILNFESSRLFDIVLVIPIMSIYYYSFDNKSIEENSYITKLSKTIKFNNKDNLYNKLNKHYIKFKSSN